MILQERECVPNSGEMGRFGHCGPKRRLRMWIGVRIWNNIQIWTDVNRNRRPTELFDTRPEWSHWSGSREQCEEGERVVCCKAVYLRVLVFVISACPATTPRARVVPLRSPTHRCVLTPSGTTSAPPPLIHASTPFSAPQTTEGCSPTSAWVSAAALARGAFRACAPGICFAH